MPSSRIQFNLKEAIWEGDYALITVTEHFLSKQAFFSLILSLQQSNKKNDLRRKNEDHRNKREEFQRIQPSKIHNIMASF